MADARRFADLRYGHAGQLTYIPRDDRIVGEPGALHTSRLVSNYPRFQQIGSSAELYPESKSTPPQLTHSHLWAEQHLQKRWLLKSHPEALMGNSELTGLLTEDIQRFRKLDDVSSNQALLAMGQMTDFSDPQRPTGAPMLAAATGESGELLRLSRIEDSQWAWPDDRDCTLCLSVIDPMDRDDEMVWASDGLPISQIKFATSLSHSGSIRWLLVQKQTSTTVLLPEYHRVPKAHNRVYSKYQERLSRISSNALLTLGHQETGGNAHSDVAFNAPAEGSAPQLCVVDECGYWTLWNVHASKKTDLRKSPMSLYRCGHIWEGPLDAVPSAHQYPAKKHGVLFVGGELGEDVWGNSCPGLGSPGGTATRSSHIFLWDSERFEIVDIETNSALPKIREFSSAKRQFGRIVDARLSPVNQNHVFILTTQFIVWVGVFHPSKNTDAPPKPAILLTCPHGAAASDGLRMATNRSTDGEDANPMVSVFSSTESQVSIHWFNIIPETGLPQWHSQMTSLSQSTKGEGQPFDLQELVFQPLKLTCASRSSGTGSRYRQEDVQFYQGMMLGQNLGIQYCMCFASKNPGLEVTLPMDRVGWTPSSQTRRWKKRRLRILHYIGQSVVVPDSMTDEVIESFARRTDLQQEGLEVTAKPASQKPARRVPLNVDVLTRTIGSFIRGTVDEVGVGLPMEIFDAFRRVLQHGSAEGRLPLMTWYEMVRGISLDDVSSFLPAEEIAEATQGLLFSVASDQTVVTQLSMHQSGGPEGPLGSFLQLHNHLGSIWLEPWRHRLSDQDVRMRETWVADLARDLFLSTHGIAVQDVPLFRSGRQLPGEDSQESMPSSFPIPPSQASMSTPPPSSPSSITSSAAEPDEAFQRLQLLAPSIRPGPLGAKKPASVLSFWPSERGVGIKDYVSSVAIASGKKSDPARQRLQKMEARRKAMVDKYKPLPAMRQEISERRVRGERMSSPLRRPQAETQIMSSQQAPGSSQSQGPPAITMSQPVPGVFGRDRKKVKREKKKSGFR